MIKSPLTLRVRIIFEPNRFSDVHLMNTYERLAPVKRRAIRSDDPPLPELAARTKVK